MLNLPEPSLQRNARHKGFTLIELLTAILIIAILMAVAIPLYLGIVADGDRKICRANMQSIANAEMAYQNQNPSHTFTTNLTALSPNLGATPVCPAGGAYRVQISNGNNTAGNGQTVPAGGLIIRCRGVGHGRFAPGIDSQ